MRRHAVLLVQRIHHLQRCQCIIITLRSPLLQPTNQRLWAVVVWLLLRRLRYLKYPLCLQYWFLICDNVPALPVSYIDAPIDSKLWTELDAVCDAEAGCDYLTIPHNSNLANGRMAPYMQLEDTDAAKVAYAQSRLKREPIMEIFQHKGNSECINGLSTVFAAPDELCNVEAVRRMGPGSRPEMALAQAVLFSTCADPNTWGH